MEKQPDISVLFVVLLTAFATFWSIKKDTADYSDYIRNGGEQDADRFYTGRARLGMLLLSAMIIIFDRIIIMESAPCSRKTVQGYGNI